MESLHSAFIGCVPRTAVFAVVLLVNLSTRQRPLVAAHIKYETKPLAAMYANKEALETEIKFETCVELSLSFVLHCHRTAVGEQPSRLKPSAVWHTVSLVENQA